MKSKIMATVLGLVAEIERDFISARTKEALVKGIDKRSIAKLLELVATLPPCLIGMEAYSGAHHWAREFGRSGHTVQHEAHKHQEELPAWAITKAGAPCLRSLLVLGARSVLALAMRQDKPKQDPVSRWATPTPTPAGMIPLAVGWGAADSSFRSPMAVAVIGGLITSTLLSLLVIPSVFTVVDDLEHFLGRIKRWALRERPMAELMPK